MKKCLPETQPMYHMTEYKTLASMVGGYRKLENYQKNLININVLELDAIREEQKTLDEKLSELEKFDRCMDMKLENLLIEEEHFKRLQGKKKIAHIFN